MQNTIRDIEVYNGFNLRDYQVKTLKKMLKSKNGLAVEIPTGMGKSAGSDSVPGIPKRSDFWPV